MSTKFLQDAQRFLPTKIQQNDGKKFEELQVIDPKIVNNKLQAITSSPNVDIPFKDLPTSTMTTMVYTNISLNRKHIFQTFPVEPIHVPLTKKKNIDKKRLVAPYGTIIFIQSGVYFRGVKIKKKKYWCLKCQLYTDKNKKIKTIEEEEWDLLPEETPLYPGDTKKLYFRCKRCNYYFDITTLRKIPTFLNQITIVLCIGDIFINIMAFGTSLKISGAKCFAHVAEALMVLWEEYLYLIPDSWAPYVENMTDVHFLLSPEMKNLHSSLNFSIDKCKLNSIMNEEIYKDIVDMSQCEPTSATHVNIKMNDIKPTDFMYDVLVYPNSLINGISLENSCLKDVNLSITNPHFIYHANKLYAPIKQKQKISATTFIVFSSSQIILTGKYMKNMKEMYEFFINIINTRKEELRECITTPTLSLREFRKKMGW